MKDLVIKKLEDISMIVHDHSDANQELEALIGVLACVLGAMLDGSIFELLEKCAEHSQSQINKINEAQARRN